MNGRKVPMTRQNIRPADTYSPLYFLASLGTGGLSVTFFMYLLFWVPHPGRPVPLFEDAMAVFETGSVQLQVATFVAMIGIAVFAFLNLWYLVWNFSALAAFRKTDGYSRLRASNGETTLLAAPLAAAMSVNVLLIAGMVFIPGLWAIRETLFPASLIAFLAIAVWAFATIADFLGRVLTKSGAFDVTAHNSFAQLLPAFAIAMVGLGMAAPAAMSQNNVTVSTALALSTFLGFTAIVYTVVAAITSFNSMLRHGTARESGPTLMIVVPILTVLGILFLRQDHGLHIGFETHSRPGETLVFFARLLTVQVIFLMLGLLVLRRQGYFRMFIFGTKTSPGSYALICPGVALSVTIHFFVNKGLVGAGAIDKFGVAYWGVTAFALAAQALMIALAFRLNRQHFGSVSDVALVPGE